MKDEFIAVPAYILKLHDPVFFWVALLDIANEKKLSQNEAFEVLSGVFEQYYHFRKYTDVRSARRAWLQSLQKCNKLLPMQDGDGAIFAVKYNRMTNEEIEAIVFNESEDGFQMTEEIAEYLGLSALWKEYEAEKALPPIELTAEEWARVRKGESLMTVLKDRPCEV